MKIRFLALAFLGSVLIAAFCSAFPEPSLVPGPNEWTLDVVYDQPHQITMNVPGRKTPTRFWYITLTLTNNSGLGDADFYPSCALVTDTFQVVKAGEEITDIVFEKLKVIHQGKYPLLESIEHVGNKILEGVDNTRDVAVIFPDFDPDAKNVTLFVSGLSNETVALDHPSKKDADGNPVKIYLRKTLALEYSIAGDKALRDTAKLVLKDKKWVMR